MAIALALLAAALGLLILAEFFVPGSHGGDVALEPAATGGDTGTARDIADRNARTVTEILSRPLFRGDRRPTSADGRVNGTNPPGDMPRLSGILMSPGANRAIFQPPGKERAIVVVEGETVGAWRVQTIAANAVTLTGPGGTRRLEPKFSNGGGQTIPQRQTAPAPASGAPLFEQQNGGMDRPQGKH